MPLLKLHGTINRPETCVATDDATRSGITPAKREALMALVTDLQEESRVPWLYVGASMRHIDLDGILAQREFNESTSEHWVAPWPEASVYRFVYTKNRWWAAQGQNLLSRTVTETADAFMAALPQGGRESWTSLRALAGARSGRSRVGFRSLQLSLSEPIPSVYA